MSIISVANIHFETTGTNRVNYTGNNVIRITSNAIQLPVGTSSARPSIEAGMIRYNTDLGVFEGANSTAWGSIGTTDLMPANNWANTVGTAGNNYTNSVGTAGNNYTNTVGASGNAYVNTVVFPVANAALPNASSTVYRGDLYFANGNVGIGIASAAPVDLYVNGGSAATINVLVDGATVTPIFGGSTGNNNFTLTLGGNRTMANPYNPIPGQSGTIYIIQDGTGGRTLAWGNLWRFQSNTAPTLSTSASAVDMLVYSVRTTSNISCQLINNIG